MKCVELQSNLIILNLAQSTTKACLVDSIHLQYTVLFIMYADPFPPAWQRDDEDVGGRASILGSLSRAQPLPLSLTLSLSPS